MSKNQEGENNSNFKHGGKGSKLYYVWIKMKQRCNNSKDEKFKDYGGRGIIICPEWTNDYTVFRDWALNNGYKEGLQINRIENNGNYEPSNCNFISNEENCQNKRTTKLNKEKVLKIRELHDTGNYTQTNIAKIFGVGKALISKIINKQKWRNI